MAITSEQNKQENAREINGNAIPEKVADEVIHKITEFDHDISEHEFASHIFEADLGIISDHTWIVEWSDKELPKGNGYIMVYPERNNEIINKYGPLHGASVFENYSFDLVKKIPGKLINEGFFIGDYTGEHKNELLSFAETGMGAFLIISGYEKENDKFADYCKIPYALVDEKTGPAPVVFTKYKGQSGLKITVYLEEYIPVHPPKHKINNYLANYFFVWDQNTRRFEEYEEWDVSN
jgi:hypothetical protein